MLAAHMKCRRNKNNRFPPLGKNVMTLSYQAVAGESTIGVKP